MDCTTHVHPEKGTTCARTAARALLQPNNSCNLKINKILNLIYAWKTVFLNHGLLCIRYCCTVNESILQTWCVCCST